MLQASLRTLVATEASPAHIAGRLNSLVCESTSAEQFATFFVARFDLRERRLTYANAGHPYPIVLSTNGNTRLLDHSDLLLGFIPSICYEERSDLLEPGERLVLFTDGISEAPLRAVGGEAGDLLGEDGFLALLRELDPAGTASEMVSRVQGRLDGIADLDEEWDDRTLLVMQLHPVAMVSSKDPAIPIRFS
jgi:sigma-B regulation protein RsbU (phosphoserine phosphatase)